MMKTILETLLPVTWSSDNAFPSYKAMRLLRFLCIAGKAISSKLVSTFLFFIFFAVVFNQLGIVC